MKTIFLFLNCLVFNVLSSTYTLIDYTPNLLIPLNTTQSQRVIYTCNGICYSITRHGFVDWGRYPPFAISCTDIISCYPFPSDDIIDVYANSKSQYIQIYWIDPVEKLLYNIQFEKTIYTFTIRNVKNVLRIQFIDNLSNVYIETFSDNQKRQIYIYSAGKTIPYFDLPDNSIYWIAFNYYKFIFYKNEIQFIYFSDLVQSYQLEGDGIVDPLQQIEFINMQISVKIFIPQTNQIRLIQFNKDGDLIQDVKLPQINSNNQLQHIQIGILNGISYYQANSTLIFVLNETYYTTSLLTNNSIKFYNNQQNVWVTNQQYFQPLIVDQVQTNNDVSGLANLNQENQGDQYPNLQNKSEHVNDKFNYQENKDLQKNVQQFKELKKENLAIDKQKKLIQMSQNVSSKSYHANDELNDYDKKDIEKNVQQIKELHKEVLIIEEQEKSNQIRSLIEYQSLQIQQLESSGALYLNNENPCVIKLQNGDNINVTSLQINEFSIVQNAFSTKLQDYYFSAKVNGNWMVFKSSLREKISYNKSSSSPFSFIAITLCTYFLLRSCIYFYTAFIHYKECEQMKDFIIKQTQTKISEELFNKCYTILTDCKLGEGAFGIVYKCQYTPSAEYSFMKKYKQNQMFACKVLTKTNDDMDMITQEIDALLAVKNCQSAIKMINYSIGSEKVYIVLELAKYSLEDCIQMKYGNRFTDNEIIQIALDLVEVIVQLRNCNFNHRDIKPSNILIMEDEKQIKLTDFGAAKRINITNFTKKNDDLIGSLAWMAPELIQAIEQYDEIADDATLSQIDYEKCDIFSLGLTLLYCILKVKLKGCNRFEYILNNYFRNLDTQHTNIDKEFRSLLRKMTSFDPKKRPTCFIIKQHLLDITRKSYQQLISRTQTELTVNN